MIDGTELIVIAKGAFVISPVAVLTYLISYLSASLPLSSYPETLIAKFLSTLPLVLLPIVAESVPLVRVTSSLPTLKLVGSVIVNLVISSSVRELLPLYVCLISSAPFATVIVIVFFFNVTVGFSVDEIGSLPLFV